MDFNYLLGALGLTRGNLSSHMSRLADAGYVSVRKSFVSNIPHTAYSISETGRLALGTYWGLLDDLRGRAQAVQAQAPTSAGTRADEFGGSD